MENKEKSYGILIDGKVITQSDNLAYVKGFWDGLDYDNQENSRSETPNKKQNSPDRFQDKNAPKGCGKRLDYPEIDCGELFLDRIYYCKKCECKQADENELCICGHEKAFHELDDNGHCIHGIRLSDSGMQNGKGCKCREFKLAGLIKDTDVAKNVGGEDV